MEKEKVIQRIKNLLDMADDVSSPNEAFIAAKRARKLMDQHQINKSDIEKIDQNTFGSTFGKKKYVAWPRWMQYLSISVAKLNDCQTTFQFDEGSGKWKTLFRGFKSDAIIANYIYEYLIERAIDLCKKREITGRSEKNFYYLGFHSAIQSKVDDEMKKRAETFSSACGRDLILVKSQLVESHYGAIKYGQAPKHRQPTYDEFRARNQGYIDGKNTSLDKQVSTHARTMPQ